MHDEAPRQTMETIAASAVDKPIAAMNNAETGESQAQAAIETEAIVASAQPIPDISTLTAARDAAAFVAQIFADPGLSDSADAEVATPEARPEPDAAPAQQVLPPVPAGWPRAAEQPLQGRRVLILGLGISGMAMARWCARAGAEVTVADTRDAPPYLEALRGELPAARFVAGAFTAQLVDGKAGDVLVAGDDRYVSGDFLQAVPNVEVSQRIADAGISFGIGFAQ